MEHLGVIGLISDHEETVVQVGREGASLFPAQAAHCGEFSNGAFGGWIYVAYLCATLDKRAHLTGQFISISDYDAVLAREIQEDGVAEIHTQLNAVKCFPSKRWIRATVRRNRF